MAQIPNEEILRQFVDKETVTRPGFTKLSEKKNFKITLVSSFELPHWGGEAGIIIPEVDMDWTQFINFLLFSCEVHPTSLKDALILFKECLATWTSTVAERIENDVYKEMFTEVYNNTKIEIVEGSGITKLIKVILGDEFLTTAVFELTKLRRMGSLKRIAAELFAGVLHDKYVIKFKELEIPLELNEFLNDVYEDDWNDVDVKYGWNPFNLLEAMERTGQEDGVEAVLKYVAPQKLTDANSALIPFSDSFPVKNTKNSALFPFSHSTPVKDT